MSGLLYLIRKYQIFLLFLLLEFIAFGLVIQNNYYQNAVFFNSANTFTGTILSWSSGLREYFNLRQINKELAQDNIQMKQLLARVIQKNDQLNIKPIQDSIIISKYTYTLAKVINNSTNKINNIITIDKGTKHGIKKGMAVISPTGIVGKVIQVKENFSTIISLLSSKTNISVQIKRNGELATLIWGSKNPRIAKLNDISTNVKVQVNDTIQTSGYANFPPRLMVGIVKKVKLIPEKTFYEIEVELSTNLSSLAYVYIIQDILKLEQDELEAETLEELSE
ncbi:MAG: rod shape-determining protein MreC [Bacteroidetes bacterium]|nr:MAG: rod shape-determining protein MreC [Bacteroidota bacterium]